MSKYKKVDFPWHTLEETVNLLLAHNKRGEKICTKFNGVTLYSDTVTMDDAYKQVTGRTYAEFKADEKRWFDESERKEREWKEKLNKAAEFWKESGRNTLDKEYWDEWDKIVPIRLEDLYKGMELGSTLEIVDALNNGCDMEEAKKIIKNQGHSGLSYLLVCAMVKEFCKRGEEFANYVR